MNRIYHPLVIIGLLCLCFGCTTARHKKAAPEQASKPPVLSYAALRTRTLAVVVQAPPNLKYTDIYFDPVDSVYVWDHKPLTDEERRKLALWVVDALAKPFESFPVFKRVEKQTALQRLSSPYHTTDTDYVLSVELETMGAYRPTGDGGVALKAGLLDEAGKIIWLHPFATVWPPWEWDASREQFALIQNPHCVEGQPHQDWRLAKMADDIYDRVIEAIRTTE